MNWMEAYQKWRPILIEAMDLRYYSPEWLDCQVMSGRAVFLHSPNAALVAEIRFYPTGARDVFVHYIAGNAEEARDELGPALEEIGQRNGCLAVAGESREGWVRLLNPAGYELYKTAVRKEL